MHPLDLPGTPTILFGDRGDTLQLVHWSAECCLLGIMLD